MNPEIVGKLFLFREPCSLRALVDGYSIRSHQCIEHHMHDMLVMDFVETACSGRMGYREGLDMAKSIGDPQANARRVRSWLLKYRRGHQRSMGESLSP
jgi:hypothetical protein